MKKNIIEKREKRNWKGLLAKILIVALLITAIPFYKEQQVTVAAATDPTMPTPIEVSDATTFANYLMDYANDAWLDVPLYSDGIALKLTKDLNFYAVEMPSLMGISDAKIWIDMNGYNMTMVPYGIFDIGSSDGIVPEDGSYTHYLNISGEGSIHWDNYEDDMQTTELISEMWLYAGAKAVISGVDMGTTRFVARSGAQLSVDEVDYSNPEGSAYTQYHCANEFTYRFYEYVPMYDSNGLEMYSTSVVHYQKISENVFMTEAGLATECDVLAMKISGKADYPVGRYIYDAGALPASVKQLKYGDYRYSVPSGSFIVDEEYGIYDLSEDGKTMTFYGCAVGPLASMRIQSVSDGDSTRDVAALEFFNNFTPYVIGTDADYGMSGKPVQATEVHFTEGSIPSKFYYYGGTSEITNTYDVEQILLYSTMEGHGLPHCIDFTFDIESGRNVDIYNRSTSSVTASEHVNVWVIAPAEEGYYNCSDSVEVDMNNLVVGFDGYNTTYYALAGSYVILSPKEEDYAIFEIEFGGWDYDESGLGYSYANGRRAYEYITHYTNGSKKLTIPNFYCTFAAYTDRLSESRIVNNPDLEPVEYEFSADRIYSEEYMNPENSSEYVYEDWYAEEFTISGVERTEESTETYYYNYKICDESMALTEENIEWQGEPISVSEEGNAITKVFKMINLTEKETYDTYDEDFDGDTTDMIRVPDLGYGCETWIKYTYTLDNTTPRITSVSATDGAGNALNLNGDWYGGSGEMPSAEVVWTTSGIVNLELEANDGAYGTGIAGYYFGEKGKTDIVWMADQISKDFVEPGIHEMELKVRDFMQEYQNTEPVAMWVTAFGIDPMAPVIYYTDAESAEGLELLNDKVYQGKLYLEVAEDISGLNQIQAYENVNDVWTLKEDILVETEASEATGYARYYITPSDTDKAYRIIVSDNAGNEFTYNNLTLAGYEQDIEVEVGTTSQTYGVQLVIPVTITNQSEDALEITNIGLRQGVTEDEFTLEANEQTQMAAGETITVNVILPEGVNAGNYQAVLDISYTNKSDNIYKSMDKAYSETIVATIEKAAGKASFSIADIYYGEKLKTVVESETNGTTYVTLTYKNKDDLSAVYTPSAPTEPGAYQARAEFAENENYTSVTVETTFIITRMQVSPDMYTITPEVGENGWYTEDVIISGTNGNLLCVTEDGVFTETLTVSRAIGAYTFYIKTPSGAITEYLTLNDIKIDKTAPEIGEEEGIYAVENWWNTFLETITFGIYQTEEENIVIKAHDDESGIASIGYYVSDIEMTLDEVKAFDGWVEGSAFTINTESSGKYVIYARITNLAGLVTYLSTDGIIVEGEEPEPVEIKASGVVHLEAGVPYQLTEGNWQVAGDATIYVGGNTFYISESGDYELTLVE